MLLSGRLFLLPLLLATVAVGCVTYSPFVNAPSEPIAKNNGEIGGALSGLTQTGDPGGGGVSLGAEGFIRYGFSDRLSLGFRTWTDDLNWTDGASVNGFSIDGIVSLSDTSNSFRYGLAPRVLFMFEDRTLRAQALFLNGIVWLPKLWVLKPYASVGGGLGMDLDPNADQPEFLYALMFHGGMSIDPFRHLSARLEIASVSEFDEINDFRRSFLVPSVILAWRF